jgi:hypothetical protein
MEILATCSNHQTDKNCFLPCLLISYNFIIQFFLEFFYWIFIFLCKFLACFFILRYQLIEIENGNSNMEVEPCFFCKEILGWFVEKVHAISRVSIFGRLSGILFNFLKFLWNLIIKRILRGLWFLQKLIPPRLQ